MPTIVNMPDLLGLAIDLSEKSSPDLLKTALLAMVNHLSLKDLKIEFRGKDAKRVEELAKQAKGEDGKRINVQITSETAVRDSVSVAESLGSQDKKGLDTEELVVVENGVVIDSGRRRSISFNSYNRLEGKVKSLQAQLEALHSQVLPGDDEILQETRAKQEAKPIADLMQSLNITKRMSGAEEGLDKMASLLETVAKEYGDLKTVIEKMQGELGENVADTMEQIKTAAKYAKMIKPREELLDKYRGKVKDEATTTSVSGQLRGSSRGSGVFSVAKTVAESLFGAQPSGQATGQIVQEGNVGSQTIKAGSSAASTKPMPILVPTPGEVPFSDGVAGSQQRSQRALEPEGTLLSLTQQDSAHEPSYLNVIPRLKPDDKIDAEKINQLLAQHEYMRQTMEYMTAQINTLAEFADRILPEIIAGMPHATELRKRIAELQKDTKPSCPEGPEDTDEVIVTSKDLTERIEGAEARLIKHQAKLKRQDMMIAEKTLDIDNRMGKLTKALADVVDVLGLRKHRQKPKEEEEMDQLFGKIGNVEEALIEIGCATQNLLDDKDYKMTLLENLTEELKLMKTLKLDRFEMEDILANKADCDELNKKVPLDRFDDVTNDLARGIDDALNKVTATESVLASTLIDIQAQIETKFEKADVEAMKEEMNVKLLALAEELGKLAAKKEGRLAAGGKQKFLTDVNCVSCDRNVAMATETGVPCIPAMADMTHMRSIRPFITYELEYLRKMKIKDPEIIKYIEYEELFRRYKLKGTESYDNLANNPHLKNRYCGGAHTVTGPHQKVPHTGHFDLKSGNKNF